MTVLKQTILVICYGECTCCKAPPVFYVATPSHTIESVAWKDTRILETLHG